MLLTRFMGGNKIKKYTRMMEEKRKGKSVKVKKEFIDIEYPEYPYLVPILQREISLHLNNFKLETELTQSIDEPTLK